MKVFLDADFFIDYLNRRYEKVERREKIPRKLELEEEMLLKEIRDNPTHEGFTSDLVLREVIKKKRDLLLLHKYYGIRLVKTTEKIEFSLKKFRNRESLRKKVGPADMFHFQTAEKARADIFVTRDKNLTDLISGYCRSLKAMKPGEALKRLKPQKMNEWTNQVQDKEGKITMMVIDPFGETDIKVRFPCRKCWAMVESSEDITIEEPNYFADTAAESIVWSESGIGVCEKCGEEHEIEVSNSIGGMLIEIDGVKIGNIEYRVTEERPAKYGRNFTRNNKRHV